MIRIRKIGKIRKKCDSGKPISGVTTYAQYSEVIAGLTLASERLGCTLFEIESLWASDKISEAGA
jgi:hypothetical protein